MNMSAHYRACVVKEYNKILMTGLPERRSTLNDISLEEVFIKLQIAVETSRRERFERFDRESNEFERERWREESRKEILTLSLPKVLTRHRCMIMRGAPGSGKTTLLRWLAVTFANQKQGATDRLGELLKLDRFPVLLELRRFGGYLQKLAELPHAFDLTEVIAKYLSQDARFGQDEAWIMAQLQQPSLLLLDGLDEIADANTRQRLLEAVNALLDKSQDMMCILTTRPHGFFGLQLRDFAQTEVKPFNLADVEQFITQWYRTAYGNDADAQQEARELVAQVKNKDRVAALATNPLLCTIIAVIYRNNRVLPNRRVDLYLKCCEAMLDTWERNKQIKDSGLIGGFDWQTKLELLMPLAYWLHGETERLAASEDELVIQLVKGLQPLRPNCDELSLKQEAREFLRLIRDRSGLLQGRGDGTLEFSHRTFQEYLAARHIASLPDLACIDAVMEHLHEAWWQEVHLLVIGHLGGRKDQAAKAERLMLTILNVYKPPFSWLLPVELDWIKLLTSYRESWKKYRNVDRFLSLGYWLPRLQWQRRIAWHLMREFNLVAQGYADCGDFGRTPKVTQALDAFATPRIKHWVRRRFYQDLLNSLLSMLPKTLPSREVAITKFITALQDKNHRVRSNAAWNLGQLGQGNEKVIDALLTALQDESVGVRSNTMDSLGQIGQGSEKVIDVLLAVLQDKDEYARNNVVGSVSQLGRSNEKVIEALLAILQNESNNGRRNAVDSLSQLVQDSEKVIDVLLSVLQDKDEYVRLRTANSLGWIGQGSEKVINALFLALQDKNEWVRHSATISLTQLKHSSKVVIDGLLGGIERWNSEELAESLAKQLKLSGGKYTTKVLLTLNQYLHDDEKRNPALEILRKVVDGKPLPGYRWRSLARRQQWWNALKSGLFSKATLGIGAVLGLVILTIVSGYQKDNESFTNALNVILTFLTYFLPFL